MECLEGREVPATLIWTNAMGDGQFNTAADWSSSDFQLRIPKAGDDILFDGPASSSGSGLGGGGSGGASTTNCNGMQADPNGAYNSVTITSAYTGTVSVTGAFSTNNFTLAGGAISQATSADITALGSSTDSTSSPSFNWTGGILNSSQNAANVNLYCNGLIDPAGGTLVTGSTIQFLAQPPVLGPPVGPGPNTTILPGSLQFNNAAGGVVGGWATVTAQTTTSGDIIGLTSNQLGATEVPHEWWTAR